VPTGLDAASRNTEDPPERSSRDPWSLGGSLRPIPAGNDLLFFLLVGVSRGHPVLPNTARLTLEEVFFSTPSGSADITVTDMTNGLLVVTD